MSAWLDVCRFSPAAGGTSDWAYSSAVTGYSTPALAGAVNGRVYAYRAESSDLTQWEVGSGAYNSGTNTFVRTTVLYNSSGTGTGTGQSGAGTKINFSTVPTVAIVALKEDLISIEEANSFTAAQKAQIQSNIRIAATAQSFLSGSGTYTTPANVKRIRVRGAAGGAGGGGAGLNGGTAGGNGAAGGTTTFGTSLLTATGGSAGTYSAGATLGGAGGSATIGSGPLGIPLTGGSGGPAMYQNSNSTNMPGGNGGNSGFGGGGASGGTGGTAGASAAANSGGGGGGGSTGATAQMTTGSGGGGGGAFDVIIESPSPTYSYSVGPGGAGGTSATSVGGAGGSGGLWIEEYYS